MDEPQVNDNIKPTPRRRPRSRSRRRRRRSKETNGHLDEVEKSKMGRFLQSQSDMFRRLDVDKNPEMSSHEWWLIFVWLFLILVSAATRITINLKLALETDSSREQFWTTFQIMFAGLEHADTSLQQLKYMHMLYATCASEIILPILFILGIIPEKVFSLVMQTLLSVIVFTLTILHKQVLEKMEEKYNEDETLKGSCRRRRSCNHSSSSKILYAIVILFSLTTIARCIFRTRVKQFIINIRIIGPYIDFFASRRSRDFQALALMLLLAYSIMSGIVLHSAKRYKDLPNAVTGRHWEVVLETISSCTTVMWLLLSFWIYAQIHHRFTHTHRVEEDVLTSELEKLGDKHKKSILDYDRQIIERSGYTPQTRDAACPVRSGHMVKDKVLQKD